MWKQCKKCDGDALRMRWECDKNVGKVSGIGLVINLCSLPTSGIQDFLQPLYGKCGSKTAVELPY